MKNKQQLYLLIGIGLLLIAFFLFPDPASSSNKRRVSKAAVSLEAVASVMVVNQGETFTLYKQAGQWKLGENFFGVDADKAKKILDLAVAEWTMELVSDEGIYHKYGLDEETRTELVLKDGEGEVLRHFYVGASGNRHNSRYVTFGEDAQIYLTFDKLGFTFDVKSEDLRQKDMLTLDRKDVEQVRVRRLGKKGKELANYTLTKEEVVLENEEGEEEEKEGASKPENLSASGEVKWVGEAGRTYNRDRFNDVLNTLLALRASSFADDELLEEYVGKARMIYEISTSDGGVPEAIVYLFEKDEEEGGYLAGVSTQNSLFYIPLDDGDRLEIKREDLF